MKNILHLICILTFSFSFANTEHTGLEIISKKQVNDSIEIALQNNLSTFKEKKDTVQIIKTNIKLIKKYSGKGDYYKSYDAIWNTLPLVESKKYADKKATLLIRLISLYMVFEQYEKANQWYLEVLDFTSKNIIDSKEKTYLLGRIYSTGAWIKLKWTKDYKSAEALALKSVNSYKQLNENSEAVHYAQINLAHVYLCKRELEKAKTLLFQINKSYPLPLKQIHGLLYERIGLYYDLIEERDSSIYYYEKSVAAIDKFDSHIDKKLQTLKLLSKLYNQKGNSKKAHQKLSEAFILGEQLFSSNKSHNKHLFEIKNKYEAQLQLNKEELNRQNLIILKDENALIKIKTWITICSLTSIFLFIIFYFNRRNKIKLISQNLELKKQEEILELKNKELLSSAAQLIERDTLQEDIKKQLSRLKVSDENLKIIKEVRATLKTNTSHKWKEFEAHFTTINSQFFSSLKSNYPKLTPTDLKMCAFIKMGFSSKDMSQIMGISVEGINTSRSRLRKKMDLTRNINLSEFLQGYKTS